jgi:hypothetical protein
MTRLWGSGSLPQGGEFPLPLPRGLGGRCGRRRRGHYPAPSRPCSAHRRLLGTRRLFRGLPGGGRSRARPRRCLLCRLHGSGRGGKGSHLSGRARPHRSPPPPPRPTTSTPKSPGRRVPAARAARTPHFSVPGVPVAGSSSPSCAPPALVPVAAPHARSGSGRGRVGPRSVHGHHLQRASETPDYDDAPRISRPKRGGSPTHQRALREHDKRPERDIIGSDDLEVDSAPRPRGRILLREEIGQQPRLRQGHGVGLFVHLEDAEPSLHERNDPPVVEVSENRGRS